MKAIKVNIILTLFVNSIFSSTQAQVVDSTCKLKSLHPKRIFEFSQGGKTKFSEKYINSTKNVDKYINTKLKLLNFGV